jgi:Flp pilus assembly protein TadG
MQVLQALKAERGVALPLTALFIVAGIALLALGIDLGHLFVVKNELQRAADAAALAGALRLMTPVSQAGQLVAATPDCGRALSAAQNLGTSNQTDAMPLPLANLSIRLGSYDPAAKVFTETGCSSPATVNAVQATASKPVDLYVGSLITGSPAVTLAAQATVLTGAVGSLAPGTRTLPLAVDNDKLPSNGEKLIIHLNPTPGDDGCWHTFFEQNPGSSLLRDMLEGTVETPPLKVGDFIKVKEGVDDATLKTLRNLLNDHGGTWEVMLPVIPAEAHTGWAEVLGFAAVRLTLVDATGQDKRIEAETLNNYVAPGALPGGTTYYGLAAGSPRLVQ